MVSRIEKIRKVQEGLIAMHEEFFGWAGGRKDVGTGYYLTTVPKKYDYDGWAKKVRQLEKAVKFLEAVIAGREELKAIGAEDAITTDVESYNVVVRIEDGTLKVGYKYNYLEELIHLVEPPVKATGELSEEEYIAKAMEAVRNMSDDERLEFYLEGFRKAYEEAKKHLDWLEEVVEDDEEEEGEYDAEVVDVDEDIDEEEEGDEEEDEEDGC